MNHYKNAGNNMETASLTEAINSCHRIPPGPPASVIRRPPGGWKTICSFLRNNMATASLIDAINPCCRIPPGPPASVNWGSPGGRKTISSLLNGFVVSIVGYPGAKEVLEDMHIIDGKAVSLKSIVFVGGLSTTVTDVELVNFFSKFGKIVATEIVLHPATKQQQKFGFVVFKSEQDAKDLVKKKEINFLGSKVMVKAARIRINPIPPIRSYEGFFLI